MKILITSGGTKVKIDSVRHIGNMSSGTFGAKIGLEYLKRGHDVVFLKSKGSKSPLVPDLNHTMTPTDLDTIFSKYMALSKAHFNNLKVVEYDDFYTYQDKIFNLINQHNFDMIILACAASDYGVENPVNGKIRSKESDMIIKLKKLPKIISMVREKAGDDCIVVGFKLLVGSSDEELIMNAKSSLVQNKLDLVVANDLRDIKNNDHKLKLVYDDSVVCVNDDKHIENCLAVSIVSVTTMLKQRKIG